MSTPPIRSTRVTRILEDLVRIDSINPMGRPYSNSQPVERQAIEYIESLFAPYADRVVLERQSCGALHENLVVKWSPGGDRAPALFESHIDTVPADDWSDRALIPVVSPDFLVGRGACDDKGCLAAMLAALLEVVEEGLPTPRPIVLLCAGDEEYGQTGICRFVDVAKPDFAYAVFGEPTRLAPVIQHKGTLRWDMTVHGKSAHTSRPELGRNAILGMMEVISALQTYQRRLQEEWRSPYLTGPTITITMIQGGRTRNATPDECTAAVDFRILPGMDRKIAREKLMEFLDCLDWRITHDELQLATPALNTSPDLTFCQEALAICRSVVAPHLTLCGEPYGTDAAWISEYCPAIVLGPGDITYAHAIDERISLAELAQGVEVYKRLMLLSDQDGDATTSQSAKADEFSP